MNKILFSLLTTMLAVAILLPLTACNTEKSGETGTTAATTEANIPTEQPTEAVTLPSSEPPAGEEMTPPLYIEGRGNLIPHTEAMLALQEKIRTSDEAWVKKFDTSVFHTTYENDGSRKGDKYLFVIGLNAEHPLIDDAFMQELRLLAGVDENEEGWIYTNLSIGGLITVCVTAEQLEIIVKNKYEDIRVVGLEQNAYY